MLPLWSSPDDAVRALGERCREARLERSWTRNSLAERAGVSPNTLKRFERTGKGSTDLVAKVAFALNLEDTFASLLSTSPAAPASINELMSERPKRQRGSR